LFVVLFNAFALGGCALTYGPILTTSPTDFGTLQKTIINNGQEVGYSEIGESVVTCLLYREGSDKRFWLIIQVTDFGRDRSIIFDPVDVKIRTISGAFLKVFSPTDLLAKQRRDNMWRAVGTVVMGSPYNPSDWGDFLLQKNSLLYGVTVAGAIFFEFLPSTVYTITIPVGPDQHIMRFVPNSKG